MKVSLEDIKKLRQETGAGFMDCKKALIEAEGDFQKAIEILRKRGQQIMKLKAGRKTEEGAVAIARADQQRIAGIVLLCETDFVAMNQDFLTFAQLLADLALKHRVATAEALLALNHEGRTVRDHLADLVGKIGENIQLGEVRYLEGPYVHGYLHYNRRVAALVAFSDRVPDEVAGNIAKHIAAMAPIALSPEDVPQDVVEKEREIARERALAEGKPEHIVDRIVEGRLKKFFIEKTLLQQPFFLNEKQSVAEYLKSEVPGVQIQGFARLSVER